MKIVDSPYEFGDIVYLKTDVDQKKRIVTAMMMRGDGACLFELSCGTEAKWHYAFEITTEKDVVMTTTNG
jgi:hypothetical protein